MSKKSFSIITIIVLFTFGTLVFIHYNNDHIECKNVTTKAIGQKGEKISTTKHICKEKYSF